MARIAKRHVVFLLLHEKPCLRRSVRLVTGEAVHSDPDLRDVFRVWHIGNRMALDGVAKPESQRQHGHTVLFEVIVREFHSAVENREYALGLQLLRLRIWSVALQAKRVSVCTQQLLAIPAMWVMAGSTPLLGGRLMQNMLFRILCAIGVAVQTNGDAIWLRQSRKLACVRAVAIRAVAKRAGMLDFCVLDFLSLFRVAGHANFLGAGLGENNFPVFGGLMAHVALSFTKRQMHESLNQFWPVRLVRIVAGQTIGFFERLILVCLG